MAPDEIPTDDLLAGLEGLEIGAQLPAGRAACDTCNDPMTLGDTVFLHGRWVDGNPAVSWAHCDRHEVEAQPEVDGAFVVRADIGTVGGATLATNVRRLEADNGGD